MMNPENHLQDLTQVIRQIYLPTLITGDLFMLRKLLVIAAATAACSGAMAATETFTFSTAGQTPFAFQGTLTGSINWSTFAATGISNVLLDGSDTGVIAGMAGWAPGVYLNYTFGSISSDVNHTLTYDIVTLNGGNGAPVSSANFSSVATGSTVPTVTNTPVAAVPEPETYAMMLAGLGALGFLGRRRKAQ